MEYRPTRKEIAYVSGMDDKKLENLLTRGILAVDDKVTSRRWRHFSFADGLKIAFVEELTKYGIDAETANFFTGMLFEFKIPDNSGNLHNLMIQPAAGEKLLTLPEMDNDEAAQFLAALDGHRWVIKCALERRGPDLTEIYQQDFLRDTDPLPEHWQSCIVIKFKPIIDGVLDRWIEIISKKTRGEK